MRASLPMYDLPGLEAATDAWWAGLAAAFRAEGLHQVPERLTREGGHAALWTAPDLLFSQTCGYPLTHALAGRVTLVATPIYDCPGCDGGRYRSEILVRAADAAGQLADLKGRSEEHTSELQSLMRISYAVFCLKKKQHYKEV